MNLWSQQETYSFKVNDLLNKKDLTIEELLVEEEELIHELKRLNPKLLDFFSNNRIIVKKLIEYITVEPKEEQDKQRCYQFPYVSCEIFECEPQPVISTLLSCESHVGLNTELTKIDPIDGDSGSVYDDDNSSQIIANEDKQKDIEQNCDRELPPANTSDDNQCNINNNNEDIVDNNKNDVCNNSPETNQESQEEKKSEQFEEEQKQQQEVSSTNSSPTRKQQINKSPKEEKQIQKKFPMLDILFQFLDNQSLNETLAGYFTKVVTILLNYRPKDIMHYLFCNAHIFEKMLKHVQSKSIAELLQNFLTIENMKCEEKNDKFLELKLKAIETFIEQFETYNEEQAANYSYIFCQIVTKYYLICDGKELLENLVSATCISNLFKNIYLENQYCATKAIELLNCIASYYLYNSSLLSSDYPETSEYYQLMKQKYEEQPFIQEVIVNIPKIANILQREGKALGMRRLKLIEFIECLCKMHFSIIDEVVIQNQVIKTVVGLFFQFEWNNILHIAVEKILMHILSDKKSRPLLQNLLEHGEFAFLLIKHSQETTITLQQSKYSKGFLGFLVKFGNKLRMLKVSDNYDLYQQFVEEPNKESWTTFCNDFLNKQVEKQNQDLGNFQEFQMNNMNYQYGNYLTQQSDDYSLLKQYQYNASQNVNSGDQKEGERGFSQIQSEVMKEDSYNNFNILQQQQQQQLSPLKNRNIQFETIPPKSLIDDQNVEFRDEDYVQHSQNQEIQQSEYINEGLQQQLNLQIDHNQQVINRNKEKCNLEEIDQQPDQQIVQDDQNQVIIVNEQKLENNDQQQVQQQPVIQQNSQQIRIEDDQQNNETEIIQDQGIQKSPEAIINVKEDLISTQIIETNQQNDQQTDSLSLQNVDIVQQNNINLEQSEQQLQQLHTPPKQQQQQNEKKIESPIDKQEQTGITSLNVQNTVSIQEQSLSPSKIINNQSTSQQQQSDNNIENQLNEKQAVTCTILVQPLQQQYIDKEQIAYQGSQQSSNQCYQSIYDYSSFTQYVFDQQDRFSYKNYLSSQQLKEKKQKELEDPNVTNNQRQSTGTINKSSSPSRAQINQPNNDVFSKFGLQLQEFEHKIKSFSLQNNQEASDSVNAQTTQQAVAKTQQQQQETQQLTQNQISDEQIKDDNCLLRDQQQIRKDHFSDLKFDGNHKRSLSTFEGKVSSKQLDQINQVGNRDLQEINQNETNLHNSEKNEKALDIERSNKGQLIQSMIDLSTRQKSDSNASFDSVSLYSNNSILSSDSFTKKRFKVIIKSKPKNCLNPLIQSSIQNNKMDVKFNKNEVSTHHSCILTGNDNVNSKEQQLQKTQHQQQLTKTVQLSEAREDVQNIQILEGPERKTQSINFINVEKQNDQNKQFRQIHQKDQEFLQFLKDAASQSKKEQKENISILGVVNDQSKNEL